MGLPGTFVRAFAIDPHTPTTVYAGGQTRGVFKSTDGGRTWVVMNLGQEGDTVAALAIDPQTPTTVYAGGSRGITKSTDAGLTCTAVDTSTGSSVEALAIDPSVPRRFTPVAPGRAYSRSSDGGQSWRAVNVGLANKFVWTLAIDPRQPRTVYAGTSAGAFKTTDGGGRWGRVNAGLGPEEGADRRNRLADDDDVVRGHIRRRLQDDGMVLAGGEP